MEDPMRLATLTLLLPLLLAADDANVASAKDDLAKLKQALAAYELDHGAYPTTKQGLVELAKPTGGGTPYLDKLRKDPWGHDYSYRCPGTDKADFDLLSGGPDGAEGGGDDVK